MALLMPTGVKELAQETSSTTSVSQASSEMTRPNDSDLSGMTKEGTGLTAPSDGGLDEQDGPKVSVELPDDAAAKAEGGSDSDDESSSSDFSARPMVIRSPPDESSDAGSDTESETEKLIDKAARVLDSRSLFEAYKKKLKAYPRYRRRRGQQPSGFLRQPMPGTGTGPLSIPEPPPPQSNDVQASNLVRGLVDYLRVLEDRIKELESGGIPRPPGPLPIVGVNPPRVSKDKEVDMSIKFFSAGDYMDVTGNYPAIHRSGEAPWAEPGTLMCDRDTTHLVRVLYTSLRGYIPHIPLYSAAPNAPNPDDIEIIMIGIASPPIISFINQDLHAMPAIAGGLMRIGKPFRPILRLLDKMRQRLSQLENEDGNSHDTEVPGTSASQTLKMDSGRWKHSVSPFGPSESKDGGWNEKEALLHFRAFLAFFDKYFAKQISLYNSLRQGDKIQTIAFENLWMLFDSGDLIYSPSRDGEQGESAGLAGSAARRYAPQGYRVQATSGGMPTIGALAPYNLEVAVSSEEPNLTPTATRRIRSTYTEFYVYCFYVDFNGIQYGTVQEIFVFRPYEREMEIRNLQAYPVHYAAGLTDRLLERGKTFINMTTISHMQYEGLTTGRSREEINSPVVVDMRLAYEGDNDPEKKHIEVPIVGMPSQTRWVWSTPVESMDIYSNSRCQRPWCFESGHTYNGYVDFQKSIKDVNEQRIRVVLEDYETLEQKGRDGHNEFVEILERNNLVRLLPGAVPGFALRNRKWVLLDLNLLKPVKQNNEWENLVLPEGHQEMVQAMVETYTKELGSNKDTFGMDLVSGKGKGCIILLHGVPGVGKTSTAECVASHTKKPLYPITCGDIGYRPEDVERNMENHFRLAHKWGCVLLLDEADVFLAKRDQRDVQRNGLVSVFLRILEYYSGILFLTTNRVGAIDDAFRSRLHLTLYYPKLDKKQTLKIFRRNFERIAEINTEREANGFPRFNYQDAEKKVIEWVKDNWKALRWNGRQIRNTFQTVLALSEFHAKRKGEQPVLTRRYFKIVANASSQFDEYLKATHGFDEDRVAKRDYIRASEYTPDKGLVYRGLDKDVSDSSTESEESESETTSDADGDSDDSDAGKKPRGKSTKAKGKKASEKNKKSSKEKEKSAKEKKDKPKVKKEESEDSD